MRFVRMWGVMACMDSRSLLPIAPGLMIIMVINCRVLLISVYEEVVCVGTVGAGDGPFDQSIMLLNYRWIFRRKQ